MSLSGRPNLVQRLALKVMSMPRYVLLRAKWETKIRLFLLAKRFPLLRSLKYLDSFSALLMGIAVTSSLGYYLIFFFARKRRIWKSKLPSLITKIVIGSNRATAPFALTYVLIHSYLYLGSGLDSARNSKIRLFRRAPVLELWLLFECVHFVFHHIKKKRLQSLTRPAVISRQERWRALNRLIEGVTEPKEWIQTWFLGVESQHIGAEDVKGFLCYCLFGSTVEDMSRLDNMDLQDMYIQFTTKLGLQFPAGSSCKATYMKHTLDPFKSSHHPLLNYGIVQAADQVIRYWFKHKGFKRDRRWRLSFWYKLGTNRAKPPIVFVHGIGIGLIMYANFINNLLETHGDRSIFLLELPHISMRMTHAIPGAGETADAVEKMLLHHLGGPNGAPPAVFMGHSFGSIIVSWMVKRKPDIIAQIIMLDPVSLCLYLPNVLLNFVYKVPETSDEAVRNYFLANELYIIHALTRHFWFVENTLWYDDVLPHMHFTVLLSGADTVVPTKGIREWIESSLSDRKHEVNLIYYENFDHGTFLASTEAQERIFDAIVDRPDPLIYEVQAELESHYFDDEVKTQPINRDV
jgi:pimeloyl-ACP methyl ester carboxylesterase